MKFIKHIKPKVRSRLPSLLVAAAFLTLNAMPAFAQAFNSTELKTGISNSLAVIMMFGFVLGISCVIYGGFASDAVMLTRKMSIIGGAIIAAARCRFAFYKSSA
jgi:glucan phosphoethanolaminetransferase (alkaline phosphatase superfamily)